MEESVGHFGYSASYAYLTASENFHSEEENDFQSSKRQENHYVKKVGPFWEQFIYKYATYIISVDWVIYISVKGEQKSLGTLGVRQDGYHTVSKALVRHAVGHSRPASVS